MNILKLKNIISENVKLLNGLNSKMKVTKVGASEIKDRYIETIYSEEKKNGGKKHIASGNSGALSKGLTCVIGVPEKKERLKQ